MFLSLLKKEIKFLIYNPAFYIAYALFLLCWQGLFFKDVFLVGVSSLSSLFDIFPWAMLIFSSALTMNAFSLEKDLGTVELLLTKPITDLQLVLAKFTTTLLVTL